MSLGEGQPENGLGAEEEKRGPPQDRQTDTYTHLTDTLPWDFSHCWGGGSAVFTKALKLLNKMVPPVLEGAWGNLGVGPGETDMGSHEPKELGGS